MVAIDGAVCAVVTMNSFGLEASRSIKSSSRSGYKSVSDSAASRSEAAGTDTHHGRSALY
jgi:hypothetical protein